VQPHQSDFDSLVTARRSSSKAEALTLKKGGVAVKELGLYGSDGVFGEPFSGEDEEEAVYGCFIIVVVVVVCDVC